MGDEITFLYPYDDAFWVEYGDFLARCSNHAFRGRDDRGRLPLDPVILLPPAILAEIMISETALWSDFSDSIIDELYFSEGTVPTDVADSMVDEIVDFVNGTQHPVGLREIGLLTQHHNGGHQLIDFFPLREEDSMVYVLARSE